METSAAHSTEHADAHGPVCAGCGYSLFGIQSDRCPECGLLIDRSALGQSQIPWTHRKSIGRWRAFWRTVWRATIRPSKIALDISLPVSFADAQRFRWACVTVAWLTTMGWVIGLIIWGDFRAETWERISAIICAGIAFFLFFTFVTGLPSYFFHAKSLPVIRQNRAVALSYYTSAPLAWSWVLGVFALPLAIMNPDHWTNYLVQWLFLPLVCTFWGVALLLAFMMESCAIRLLSKTTHCSKARCWALAIYLPVGWALAAALCLVAIPAIVLFIAIVIISFH